MGLKILFGETLVTFILYIIMLLIGLISMFVKTEQNYLLIISLLMGISSPILYVFALLKFKTFFKEDTPKSRFQLKYAFIFRIVGDIIFTLSFAIYLSLWFKFPIFFMVVIFVPIMWHIALNMYYKCLIDEFYAIS